MSGRTLFMEFLGQLIRSGTEMFMQYRFKSDLVYCNDRRKMLWNYKPYQHTEMKYDFYQRGAIYK